MANDVRTAPVHAVFKQHPQTTKGICRWCGDPTEEKTEKGKLRWWHDACETEYLIIIRPDVARRAVEQRDHGICCDCGEDWSDRYIFRKSCQVSVSDGWFSEKINAEQDQYRTERAAGFWVYTELVSISLWHVDHKTPLWKARHLPPLQRLEYFKLANLITRCHKCHERKTTEEAAERAKFNRLAEPPAEKPKAKWGTRKLQSRNTLRRKP